MLFYYFIFFLGPNSRLQCLHDVAERVGINQDRWSDHGDDEYNKHVHRKIVQNQPDSDVPRETELEKAEIRSFKKVVQKKQLDTIPFKSNSAKPKNELETPEVLCVTLVSSFQVGASASTREAGKIGNVSSVGKAKLEEAKPKPKEQLVESDLDKVLDFVGEDCFRVTTVGDGKTSSDEPIQLGELLKFLLK